MNVNGYPGKRVAPDPEERISEEEAFAREQAATVTVGDRLPVINPEILEQDDIGGYDPEEQPEDVEPGRVRYVDVELPDVAADAAEADPTGPIKVIRNGQGFGFPAPKLRKPPRPRTARERAARDSRPDLKPWPYGSKEE